MNAHCLVMKVCEYLHRVSERRRRKACFPGDAVLTGGIGRSPKYRDEAKRNRDMSRYGVNLRKLLVAMRLGVTPVPIPNTMVKTQAADGTMLETAWESRWLPESLKK